MYPACTLLYSRRFARLLSTGQLKLARKVERFQTARAYGACGAYVQSPGIGKSTQEMKDEKEKDEALKMPEDVDIVLVCDAKLLDSVCERASQGGVVGSSC